MSVFGYSFANAIRGNKGLYRFLRPVADKYVDIAGYKKIGLKYDDILIEENSQVQKALSRLTPAEKFDRAYRLRVASNCSMLHKSLPKEQWVQTQDDIRYLTPLVEDVMAEEAERAYWDGAEVVKPKKGH